MVSDNVLRFPNNIYGFLSSTVTPFIISARNESSSSKNKDKLKLVTLIDDQGKSLGEKTKGEAEDLAKAQNMQLRIVKFQKQPVYQLTSAAKVAKGSKDGSADNMKKLSFTSSISEHDLRVKCSIILRILKKGENIMLVVKAGSKNLEDFFQEMEKEMKNDAKLVNKTISKDVLKFKCQLLKKTPEQLKSSEKKDVVEQEKELVSHEDPKT